MSTVQIGRINAFLTRLRHYKQEFCQSERNTFVRDKHTLRRRQYAAVITHGHQVYMYFQDKFGKKRTTLASDTAEAILRKTGEIHVCAYRDCLLSTVGGFLLAPIMGGLTTL